MWKAFGAVAVLILAMAGRNVTADDAKGDLKSLQGTWELTYFERNGEEMKLQAVTKCINTGDKFVLKRGDEVVAAGTMKLDASKSPRHRRPRTPKGPTKAGPSKAFTRLTGIL